MTMAAPLMFRSLACPRCILTTSRLHFWLFQIILQRFQKATQTVSDLTPDAGDVQEHRKPSIFMIFDQNQWKSMENIENPWKSWFFMKIDDFHDQARLWQSRSAKCEKIFFHKKCFILGKQKHITHRFWHSDGYGSRLRTLKTSIFMILDHI